MNISKIFKPITVVGIFILMIINISCNESLVGIEGFCPLVESTTPANLATEVQENKIVTVTFEEKINPATMVPATFNLTTIVTDKSTGSPVNQTIEVNGSMSFNNDLNTMTFTPDSPLISETVYTGRVKNTIEDPLGNKMLEDYVWTFTTDSPNTFTLNVKADNGSVEKNMDQEDYTDGSQVVLTATAARNSISPSSLPGGIDLGTDELGGITLEAGTYKSATGTYAISDVDLTLDAKGDPNATWIFQAESSLTVGTPTGPRSIIMANGALPKNVFWLVGSSATINGAGGGITVEPSIRVAPFKSNFYLYAGPRIAFGMDKSFEYNVAVNPDFPNSSQSMSVNSDFSEIEKTQISMQTGTGLDIPISSSSNQTQYMISPFISYQPYFAQTPRSIETWNITTIRAGVAIKFGKGKRIETQAPVLAAVAPLPSVNLRINSPENAPADRIFIESFPIRNYVFFNQESTSIPNRYISINRSEASDFNNNQTVRFNQYTSADRSARQMTVYYNILNILGDRMVNNTTSNITLIGSSARGVEDATTRAESVKAYLVDIFGNTHPEERFYNRTVLIEIIPTN